jgi:uncharacterized protein YcfL
MYRYLPRPKTLINNLNIIIMACCSCFRPNNTNKHRQQVIEPTRQRQAASIVVERNVIMATEGQEEIQYRVKVDDNLMDVVTPSPPSRMLSKRGAAAEKKKDVL